MNRNEAVQFCHTELQKWGLTDWHVRLNQNSTSNYLGLCSYKDKCIILNAHHVDINPDEAVKNTILHEVAHALCPDHGHDEIWEAKAREVGCTYVAACSYSSLNPAVIDAIRSGADVVMEVETEVIHRPKYTISRLQDKCEFCGKVAKEKKSTLVEVKALDKPDLKIIVLECGHTVIKKIPKGTPFQTLVSNASDKRIQACSHQFDKNKCLKCGEYQPFPFQVEGMQFIEAALAINKGVCVFDEMGLGKTVQSLGYLKFHPEAFPVLCIVKSGLKFQYLKEIIRWLGPEYTPQVIESSQDILIPQLKVYIASYDIFTPKTRKGKNGKLITQGFDVQKILDRGIKTVLLDECQQIKNPDATRTQQVRKIAKAANVIGTSGTPWKNRGSELFTILNMVAPTKFSSHLGFINRWVEFYYRGNVQKEGGIRNIEAFKEYTKDIVIRRERCEVMKDLPTITRTRHFIELDNVTQKTYDDEVSDFVKWYNDLLINDEENTFETQQNLLARLARMRHITGLAKIPATVEWTEEFVEETDRKLVTFVHHKDVAKLLFEEYRQKFGSEIPVFTLSAELNSQERFETQERFNKYPRALLIASTLASGEGLNLQTCSDCIMHERQWNPANEEQAEGRFIRIGQQATAVNATYMTAAGTVDEFLSNIVEDKRVRFHAAMNKGEMPVWNQNDLMDELVNSIIDNHNKKQSKAKKYASL